MLNFKLNCLQFDCKHNLQANLNYIQNTINQKEQTHNIWVLPELSTCGYLFKNQQELSSSAQIISSSYLVQSIQAISKQYQNTIIFGLAEKDEEKEDTPIYNTALVISLGKIIGKYRKIHLSDLEKQYFTPGYELPTFTIAGIKIGIQICFDLHFPEISRHYMRSNVDLLIVLANFGGEQSYNIAKIRALENLSPLILCNRVGQEKLNNIDAKFLGRSVILDHNGNILAQGQDHTEQIVSSLIHIDPNRVKGNIICSDFIREMAIHYKK